MCFSHLIILQYLQVHFCIQQLLWLVQRHYQLAQLLIHLSQCINNRIINLIAFRPIKPHYNGVKAAYAHAEYMVSSLQV